MTERIVVRVTPQDKKALAAKAKVLGFPLAELMRRGAFAYRLNRVDDELVSLSYAAKGAADRACAAIDDALDFIAASNERIAAMEAEAVKR